MFKRRWGGYSDSRGTPISMNRQQNINLMELERAILDDIFNFTNST